MKNEEYWKLSKDDRAKQDIIEAKETEPNVRYYLWGYNKSYGWRQMGNGDGYATLEELKNDDTYRFSVEQGTIMKIMKARGVE